MRPAGADTDRRALQIFDELCDLCTAQQEIILRERCSGDANLMQRVEALLEHDRRESGPIRSANFGEGAGWIADALRADDDHPERIGPYRIVRQLGRGGMGVVYEAEQESPRRRVALKVIAHGLASREAMRRFKRETQTLARLDHSGIARIHEAGTAPVGGVQLPYFAMELVDGIRLDAYAEASALDRDQRLELIARLGDAVHHAHQRGIIHRDLKPANVLVLEPDPSSSGTHCDRIGQPKILDFGVARVTGPDGAASIQTQTGQIVGTLAFMGPELLDGVGEPDVRSDVYALGVMLYELIAGRPPHAIARLSVAEAARIVSEQEPLRLGSIDATCRGDVETIVHKAMDRSPEQRYASAAALADDIRRYLDHEPILARPASSLYQMRKFAKRNRALVGGVIATIGVLIAGLVAVSVLLVVVSNERDRAVKLREKADIATAEARTAARRARSVADFQAGMLSDVRVTEAGANVLEEFRNRLMRSLEERVDDPDLLELKSATLDEALSGVAGPDLVRFLIDDAILRPARKRVDRQRDLLTTDVQRILHSGLGIAYEKLGINERARVEFETAIRLAEESDHPVDLIGLRYRLALILDYMDRPAEAIPHLRVALEDRISRSGPAFAESLQMRLVLVGLLADDGWFTEAMDECKTVIQIVDESRDDRIASVRQSALIRLGVLQTVRGNPGEGLRTLDEVDQARGDGKRPMWLLHGMGLALTALERFEEAEGPITEYVEGLRRMRGQEHPWTLGGLLKLADLRLAEGHTDQAVELLEAVLARQQKVFPPDETASARTRIKLVAPLVDLGRLDEARVHLEAGSGHVLSRYADESPQAMEAAMAQARVRLAEGDHAAALELSMRVYDGALRRMGPKSPLTLEADQLAGAALESLGRWAEAEARTRRAIDGHWMIGRRRGMADLQLGRILVASGRIEEARNHLSPLVQAWDARLLTDHSDEARAILDPPPDED